MSLEGTAKAKNVLVGKVSLVDVMQGDSAYEVAVSNGFKGTEEEWLASLKGEKGDTGEKGEKGDRGEKGEKGDSGSGTGDMLTSMYDPQGKKTDIFKALSDHADSQSNPHGVTAEQVGTYSTSELDVLFAKKIPVLDRAIGITSDDDLLTRIEAAAATILANNERGGAAILPIHFSAAHSVLGASNNTLLIRLVSAIVIEVVANVEAGGFTTRVQRIKTANGWGAFEYVNPPMQLGVEYRTTERYLGKPVYVKAVDCGALPNTTSKTLAFGESGVAETISFVGVTSYGVVLTGSSENEHGCSLLVRLNGITLKTQTDQTGFTAIVTVKYIKNTD